MFHGIGLDLTNAALLGGARLPSVPGFYNFTGSNLSVWNTALAAQQAGTADAIISAVGNSTTAGVGAANSGFTGNPKSKSWPAQLAGLISGGKSDNIFSDNRTTQQAGAGAFPIFDTRVAFSGGISVTTTAGVTFDTLGGNLLTLSSAGTLSFTPANSFDTIFYGYVRAPANGSYAINVDGGSALATVNTAGTNGFLTSTISGITLGNHTINLVWISGTSYPVFIATYNSAVKQISVYNIGACGWNSANFNETTYPWNAAPAVAAVPSHLIIYEGGVINDWQGANSASTFQNNIASWLAYVKARTTASIILMSGAPSNPGVSYATQLTYINAMKAQAYLSGVPFINQWELRGGVWVSADMNDSLHDNQTGYALQAGNVNQAIMNPLFRAA